MNILVTGSAGFVGSDLVPKLNRLGHKTIGIDIVEEQHSSLFIRHDLTGRLDQVLPDIDVCIHLASSVGGIVFNIAQTSMDELNQRINASVIDICRRAHCSRMVFFSTINVFESNETFLHEKLGALDQRSAYAISKAKSERVFEENFANLTVIRPTNLFGRNQSRRHEKFGESHVIPDLLKKIDESQELEVFGDGSQIRNFVHVGDVTGFVVKNLDFSGHRYFNLRSDNTITIKVLVEELMRFRNKVMPVHYKPEYLKYEMFKIRNFDITIPVGKGFEISVASIGEGLTR